MRSLKLISYLLLMTIILVSCSVGAGQPEEKDPLLEEAFKYHNEAADVEKSLGEVIEGLKAKKITIQSNGEELTERDMEFIDNTNRIEKSYKRWQTDRVEVPGFGDHANCSHDHSHDVQLTPQQMMEVQKESLKNIGDMLKKAEEILQK